MPGSIHVFDMPHVIKWMLKGMESRKGWPKVILCQDYNDDLQSPKHRSFHINPLVASCMAPGTNLTRVVRYRHTGIRTEKLWWVDLALGWRSCSTLEARLNYIQLNGLLHTAEQGGQFSQY